MLEYLAYRKYKARRDRQTDQTAVPDVPIEGPPASADSLGDEPSTTFIDGLDRGKSAEIDTQALSASDEQFLENILEETDNNHTPSNLKDRITLVVSQWNSFSFRKPVRSSERSDASTDTSTVSTSPASSSNLGLRGQVRPDEAEDTLLLSGDLMTDETQMTQMQRLFAAFSMNLSRSTLDQPTNVHARTVAERLSNTFQVSTFNNDTKRLMSEFLQILKDIQKGAPLAGQDLKAFFEKHASDLKTANDSVPSFVKALILKLLPSAVPSIEELSKPGALMALIRSVLQVLRVRFPAFVGGSVLMVMAVVVVMLGLFYAFKRGRDEREGQDMPAYSRVSTSGVPDLDRGRQIEISVDGVRYVTVLDADGMRIPCPEDERGVYWDGKNEDK